MGGAEGVACAGRRGRVPVAVAVLAVAVGGCTVGNDFVRPDAPDVATYTVEPMSRETIGAPVPLGGAQRFVAAESVDERWWRALGSPRLDAWIEAALRDSPTVAAAEATLRQAEHSHAARAGSTNYPRVTAGIDSQRAHASNAQPGGERVGNLFGASVNVTYDLDIAGGGRRALEALGAQVRYEDYRLRSARIGLAASIAMAAITQAKLTAQLRAHEIMLAAQQEQLASTRSRHQLGAASRDDVLALELRVAQTRAAVPAVLAALEQADHLLAVLAGQAPGGAQVPRFGLGEFNLPRELPVVVPSELVRSRPDIQAAEALLHAATARHGVAVSKLYPRVGIDASLGSQALAAGSLFGPASLAWALVARAAQPLFDKGLPEEARGAQAAVDAAVAHYRRTVLEAFGNVADVLRALEKDARVLRAQAIADRAAFELLQSTRMQYEAGAVSYVQLLVAEQQAQEARIALLGGQAQRLVDTVALYQALGSGDGNSEARERRN